MTPSEHESEVMTLRNRFYDRIREAHSAGLTVGRIIALTGFATTRYILGDEAIKDWRRERGYTNPTTGRVSPLAKGASPSIMPQRRNT